MDPSDMPEGPAAITTMTVAEARRVSALLFQDVDIVPAADPQKQSAGCPACAAKVRVIRDARIDADNPNRNSHPGMRLFRVWLRSIHMRLVGGWGPDTSQDEIARLLGEHPRGHEEQFSVDVGKDS